MLPPRSGVTDSQQDTGSVVNWPWQATQLEQYTVTFFFFFFELVYVANLEFIKVNEGFWRNVG